MTSRRTSKQAQPPFGAKPHSRKLKNDQEASGVLNDSEKAANHPFIKSIEPLELAEVEHFSRIPDFIDPTRSPYPIVVKSPSSLQCIDGRELIEAAKQRGEKALTCEIIHIQRDSEIEVAIWKAAVRTMPMGGTCTYPEKMGNACRLFKMLIESSDNAVIFYHGGARRGDSFTDNPEGNIRLLLANRLGKSVTTINKYLQHGSNLSEEALQALISADVQKGFFEAIQKDKQRLIDELTSAQKSHDEIVNTVSERVISWFEATQTSDPVEIATTEEDQDEAPAPETQPQLNVAPPPPVKPIEHRHWVGNPSAASVKPPIEDEICQEFINVGQLLIETAENKALTTQNRIQIFSDQIIRQSRLIQQLKHLMAQQSISPEEQR